MSKTTHFSVAETIFKKLKQYRLTEQSLNSIKRRMPEEIKAHEAMLRAALLGIKQQTNPSIRKKEHLHISLTLFDEPPPRGTFRWEHTSPIDLAWGYALTLDGENPEDVKKLEHFMRTHTFVRSQVSLDDDYGINCAYTNSKTQCPPGWKVGDCIFARYACLGEEKIKKLKTQLEKHYASR